MAAERLALLQRSWSLVADQYHRTFSPLFFPWIQDTLSVLAANSPPPGVIAVPCCGPGQELALVAAAFPQHRVVGLDLAEGMVRLAQQLVEGQGLGDRVEVRVGDASQLDSFAPLAAVLSVFGLQQMPQPAEVLANWTGCLAPGGVLAVCYWPAAAEESGPWQRLFQLTAGKPQADWEGEIPSAALRQGAQLVLDCRPAHEMAWPSVEAFWEGMTRGGPWHSRRLLHGDQHMEELRRQFMQAYPDLGAPLRHSPHGRLICLRRHAASL